MINYGFTKEIEASVEETLVMLQRFSILLSRSTFTTAICQVQQRRSP